MNSEDFKQSVKRLYFNIFLFFFLLLLGSFGLVYIVLNPNFLTFKSEFYENQIAIETINMNDIENGIHMPTGFKVGEGLEQVVVSCTPCHSAKLVTQNRATKEGWLGIIRWMQATQNLWDLGENESVIINYLGTYYAPEKKGRRVNLENVDWYDLE